MDVHRGQTMNNIRDLLTNILNAFTNPIYNG